MNRFRSLLFPLALALILGIITAWLGRASEVSVEETALDPAKPQYTATNLHAKRFDISGSLNQELSAPEAWQLPDRKNVFFRQPVLKSYREGQARYTVSSDTARYETASRQAFFQHNVVLAKTADDRHPAARILTETLDADTAAQTARSDAPVQYEYGESTGSATGMDYDNKSGVLNLHSNVKALIYDFKHR